MIRKATMLAGVTGAPNVTAVAVQQADARSGVGLNHNETLLSEDMTSIDGIDQ